MVKTIDPLNNETSFTYDDQFRLMETIDPLKHVTLFDYDSEHHLNSSTESLIL